MFMGLNIFKKKESEKEKGEKLIEEIKDILKDNDNKTLEKPKEEKLEDIVFRIARERLEEKVEKTMEKKAEEFAKEVVEEAVKNVQKTKSQVVEEEAPSLFTRVADIIVNIDNGQLMTIKRVAKDIKTSEAYASTVIRALVKKGIIKEEKLGTAKILKLTERGLKLKELVIEAKKLYGG